MAQGGDTVWVLTWRKTDDTSGVSRVYTNHDRAQEDEDLANAAASDGTVYEAVESCLYDTP